jgi:transcriptional regulator with XRE-family HTH domain
MPAMKAIGPQVRIRDLRLAHGLTIPQLVQRIAEHGVTVHPDSISNVENGNKRPSQKLLVAWAAALGISGLDVWMPADQRKPEAA